MPSFEHCDSKDKFKDFCLWEYSPLCNVEGKIRSINLLQQSFDVSGANSEKALRLCHKIRQKLGSNLCS